MKLDAIAAQVGLTAIFVMLTVPATVYHSRDTHFYPDDVSRIVQKKDGPHLVVLSTSDVTLADFPLTKKQGRLTGQGTVMGDHFEAVVDEDEVLFVHEHGSEKLWLGRDVVHVALTSG